MSISLHECGDRTLDGIQYLSDGLSQAAIGDVNADARAVPLRQQTLDGGLRQSPAMQDLTRIEPKEPIRRG